MLQPAIKYSQLKDISIEDAKTYYNITGTSLDSNHLVTPGDTFNPPTITRHYTYTQTHDSISIGHKVTGTKYYSLELPVLLQYKFTDMFKVYGGVYFNFSKTVQITEDRKEFKSFTRKANVDFPTTDSSAPYPSLPSAASLFQYQGNAYSTYNADAFKNPATDPLKIGYMLGFTYAYNKRILFDILVQQMLTNPAYIPNDKVRSIYTQPYVRVTLGYRLY
jgi:hypothetical protein